MKQQYNENNNNERKNRETKPYEINPLMKQHLLELIRKMKEIK